MAIRYPLAHKRVLITSGPTWVAIDPVRVISNRSTGALGRILALLFSREKARVTLLEGPVPNTPAVEKITVKKFFFYDDLRALMANEVRKKYDIVVHASAVSDYRVRSPRKKKLRSGSAALTIRLTPTAKIIETIKQRNADTFLVGFKLGGGVPQKKLIKNARALCVRARCDLVVANSLDGGKYTGIIIDSRGRVCARAKNRRALANTLIATLKRKYTA